MSNSNIDAKRQIIRAKANITEAQALQQLSTSFAMQDSQRKVAQTMAVELSSALRDDDDPGLMEVFLAQYGLSTDEGVALMCLAEALLRVPDLSLIHI